MGTPLANYRLRIADVRYGSLADITARSSHVRFAPKSIVSAGLDVRKVPLADSAIAEPRFYRAEVGAGLATYAADAV